MELTKTESVSPYTTCGPYRELEGDYVNSEDSAHIEVHAFGKFSGMCENLSTLMGRQRSKRASVKSRSRKSETTVHTVGSQLQSLLGDVPLPNKHDEHVPSYSG